MMRYTNLIKKCKHILDNCREALRLWGYKEAVNASQLINDFNPLLKFPHQV